MRITNSHIWTGDDIENVAQLLKAKQTAAQIGAVFGVSRNAITGLVFRNPYLKSVGFDRKSGFASKGGRPKGSKNRIRKPKPITVKAVPAKPIVMPAGNERALIDAFIRDHGVRRFEQRETSEYYAVQTWLRERGYKLTQKSSSFTLTCGRGRPKAWRQWSGVLAFVDEIRTSEGLAAFLPRPHGPHTSQPMR
jgi:hypothetical protein